MAAQRRTGAWLAFAIAIVTAVLVWWLLRDRGQAEGSAQAELAHANGSAGSSARKRPVGAKLDLAVAAKAAISGTIRDPDGTPIADAQVCALSSVEARRGLDDRKPHCTRSAPDGRYRIDDLLPIDTGVFASAATFKPGAWQRRGRGNTRDTVPLRAGQTAEGIDVILEPGGVLVEGVVRDIAGGEIEGAQVFASSWAWRSAGTAFAVSGPEGRFSLWTAPGTVNMSAQADGYALGMVTGVAPGELIEIYLTPESVLVGKVVLASSGEPVEGAVVSPSSSFFQETARTDAAGRFRIEQLQPGSYKPTVESDELYGQAAEQVHLGLGQTSEEIVIRVHPAVLVEGQVVVAGSNEPCTSGSVRLDNQGVHSEREQLDQDGHVVLRGVLAGEYKVYVYCEGHIAQDEYEPLVVGEQSIAGLVWEVREGLAIRGEVVDEAGQPLEHIEVHARAIADPDAARSQLTGAAGPSERDGSFELAGLLPGRYEVSTAEWDTRPGPLEPITVELETGADVNDVRIVLPAVGTIRGRVIDETGKPVSGANLHAAPLSVAGRGSQTARSNDAGEFTLENLRPGQTRVTASSGAAWWTGTSMRKPGTTDDDIQGELVAVVANEVVELTLIVESQDGRITGVVKDEGGGPVADAFIDVERMSDKAGASPSGARRGVRWSFDSKPVLTDADGRFELDGLPDGKFIVRASRKGGGEALIEDVALGSHIELIITSTGELGGTVKLADGRAPERFSISITDKVAGVALHDSFFRTDGVWRLREIPAGNYEILASASEGSVTLEPAIALAEGEVRDDLELVLDPRLTLRGRVIDLETREPIAGIMVYTAGRGSMRSADAQRRNVTGVDGRFELDNVAVGRVEIVARERLGGSKTKYDWFSQTLELSAEPLVQDIGDLEIVAMRVDPKQKPGDLGFEINAFDPTVEPSDWQPIVALVRPGGPADGTGLVAGDVIEKVDGHDVLGINRSRYGVLVRVPEGSKLTLTLRGGNTIEIVAGPPIQ